MYKRQDVKGKRSGTDADSNLYALFEDIEGTLRESNKMGDVAATPSQQWYVLMPVRIRQAFQRETRDYDADVLKTNYVDGEQRTTIFGRFTIVESNLVKQVSADPSTGAIGSGVKFWPIHIYTPEAVGYAERFEGLKVITPEINQSGNDFLVYYKRQRETFTADSRYLYRP